MVMVMLVIVRQYSPYESFPFLLKQNSMHNVSLNDSEPASYCILGPVKPFRDHLEKLRVCLPHGKFLPLEPPCNLAVGDGDIVDPQVLLVELGVDPVERDLGWDGGSDGQEVIATWEILVDGWDHTGDNVVARFVGSCF